MNKCFSYFFQTVSIAFPFSYTVDKRRILSVYYTSIIITVLFTSSLAFTLSGRSCIVNTLRNITFSSNKKNWVFAHCSFQETGRHLTSYERAVQYTITYRLYQAKRDGTPKEPAPCEVVGATNSDFLFPMSLKFNFVDPRHFKKWNLSDQIIISQFEISKVYKIKLQRYMD